MKILSSEELNLVSAAMASMSGSFSMGPGGYSFGNNFVITVTDGSSNIMGAIRAYANKFIDGSTGTVLFDGTQSSFCFKGYNFVVSAVAGGHSYSCTGICSIS